MNRFRRNQHPSTLAPTAVTKHIGKLATKNEKLATEDDDWTAAALAAKPVPKRREGSQPAHIWTAGTSLAMVKTHKGAFRGLQGIMFMGRERYGLVVEAPAEGKTPTKFLLTKIGNGQTSGLQIRDVDLTKLEGEEKFNFGREPKHKTMINNVVSHDDPSVSREHAELTVSNVSLDLVDENSTNGTTYLAADQFIGNADPAHIELVQAMAKNPALWSGEYGGATVVPAQ